MYCPICGHELQEEVTRCPNCRKLIKKRNKEIYIFCLFILFLMITLGNCLYKYMSNIGTKIILDDSDIPEIKLKADNCYSQFVENEIISIFKENDPYFKSIALKSIDTVYLKDKEILSSDKNSQQFVCSAIIEITSDKNGFKPTNFKNSNPFFKRVNITNNNTKILKYTNYIARVYYVSEIGEGKNTVEIKNLEIGEFGCSGDCNSVNISEKKQKKVYKKPKDKIQKTVKENKQTIQNISYKVKEKESPKEQKTEKAQNRVKKKRNFKFLGWFRKNRTSGDVKK